MRIGIIGAGAIGCLFGAILAKAGNQVVLVHRSPKVVNAINRNGLRLREPGERTLKLKLTAHLAPADLKSCDLVVVAVKAYDTTEAARMHRRFLTPDSTILTLQNGLDNLEALSRVFGKTRVLAGSTTEGSLSIGPGSVIHTGRGRTWIGDPRGRGSERCSNVVGAFQGAGLHIKESKNITGVVWSKTIVNSAINPVSALTGLSNGLLPKMVGMRETMLEVVKEGVAVSRMEKVRLEPVPQKFLFETLRETAQNRSSMLQDVQRGKRTEVHQLNGAIVERGAKFGIPTPVNKVLTFLVSGLEAP